MPTPPGQPDHLDRVAELFNAARRLPAGERSAFIDQCGDDEPTRAEVEALLAEDDHPYAELDGVAVGLAPPVATDVPERIGPYRIVSVLGHGGMGVVYEALQDRPARSVALKVILPGLASPSVLRRFEHEAEALARLSHPGIASIYDAGTAPSDTGSRPYFAMELVRGSPLTAYAHLRHLPVPQRLRLVAEIADAVQYAHQRGVIHRDLKPSNILVNDDGRPRILDFGVAKLTDHDLRSSSVHTVQGQLIGTLTYMSPEQIAGDPLAVDIRADVYALGVILYELLAGRLPLEVENKPITEAARTILDCEPVPLGRIDRALRGDLETIVAKTLEKDRARRYASAADLAADLHRYLGHQPISARPASTLYLVRKFARRHTASLAFGAAIIVLLTAGSITSTLLYLNADAGWGKARREAGKYSAINEFLVKDLIDATFPEGAGHDAKLVDALRGAETALDRRFPDQPEVRGALRLSLGRMHMGLGDLDAAEHQVADGAQLLRSTLGPDHPDTINADCTYVAALADLGRWNDAEARIAELAERSARALGPDHRLTLITQMTYGDILQVQHKYDRADPMLSDCVVNLRRTLGPEAPEVTDALNIRGASLLAQNRFEEAEAVIREELDIRTRRDGPDAFYTVLCGNNLGETMGKLRRFQEADPVFRRAVEAMERGLPAGHWRTAIVRSNLATNLMEMRRFEEAEALLKESVADLTAALGEGRFETRRTRGNLASVYIRSGNDAKLEPLFREEIQIRSRNEGGPEAPGVVDVREKLARFLLKMKRLDEAAAGLAELEPLTQTSELSAEIRFRIIADQARLAIAKGDLDTAQATLARAVELHTSASLPPAQLRSPAQELADALASADRIAEADHWRRLAGPATK